MLKTYVDQVADSLREGLREGRWTGTMPGGDRLARELGANNRTVVRALAQLEKEGLIQAQGSGRPRKIVQTDKRPTALHVSMILYEQDNAAISYILELRRQLESAGHQFSFAPKTLKELKQDPERVAKMVEANPAGAWIVAAGASSVLEWFLDEKMPAFALFGSMVNLPMAGTGSDMMPALREGLDCLYSLGHRKIVMLTRKERRVPKIGQLEQNYLQALEDRDIKAGAYNLPDWEESAEGLERCLDSLFAVTPPSAIIIGDSVLFLAVKNYLALRRGKELRQVALISMDHDPRFDWCAPPVAHFQWDEQAVVRSITRWVYNVGRGKEDRRQVITPSKFIGGESLTRAGQ